MGKILAGFYRRLLQRQPQEIVLVIIFLILILLLQFMAADLLKGEDDFPARKTSRESKLSRKQAIWEVIYLQEEVGRLKDQISQLELEIVMLKTPPNNTFSLNNNMKPDRFYNKSDRIHFGTFQKDKAYFVSELLAVSDAGSREIVRSWLRQDINHTTQFIVNQYNTNPRDGIFYSELYKSSDHKGIMVEDDLWNVHFRLNPHVGMEYNIIFGDPSPENFNDDQFYQIKMTKPFLPAQSSQVTRVNAKSKTVNVILPLMMGKDAAFKSFLHNLIKIKTSSNFKLHLTVVLHKGFSGLLSINAAISQIRRLGFPNINIVNLETEKFNRGLAIQRGVEDWKGGNDIMFICDVDVTFGQDFLQRCIIHTDNAKSAYYPLVFSRYSPEIVDFFRKVGEISEDTHEGQRGYWESSGYGVHCIHRNNYLRLFGNTSWKTSTTGPSWGDKHMSLYELMTGDPEIQIIRAPDLDIFNKGNRYG